MPGKKIFIRDRAANAIRACALCLSLVAPLQAWPAETLPVPPCGTDTPVPSPSTDPKSPEVDVWTNVDWTPSPCLSWGAGRYRFVSVITGPSDAVNADDLLRRLGAISATTGLQYFSVTENTWLVLVENATALAGVDDRAGRPDFTPREMRTGAPLYFREKDNRLSQPTDYRMRVLKATEDEIIAETTNLTPIESFGLTLFPPSSLHFGYVARRLPARGWILYLVSAADAAASALVVLGRDSYLNRATALYGHVARSR